MKPLFNYLSPKVQTKGDVPSVQLYLQRAANSKSDESSGVCTEKPLFCIKIGATRGFSRPIYDFVTKTYVISINIALVS